MPWDRHCHEDFVWCPARHCPVGADFVCMTISVKNFKNELEANE
jgi:hypothetical protein